MIGEYVFTGIMGGLVGFTIYYFWAKIEEKSRLKDIVKKMEKQKEVFDVKGEFETMAIKKVEVPKPVKNKTKIKKGKKKDGKK